MLLAKCTINVCHVRTNIHGRPKKWGHRLTTIILSNLKQFKKFFTGRFCSKSAVKWIFRKPLYLAYVATIPF